jgi:hypothetical protein
MRVEAPASAGNSANILDDPSLIGCALSLACRRHRLARETGGDDVDGWRVGDLGEVAEVRDAEPGVEYL